MLSRVRSRLNRTFFGETLIGTTANILADMTDVSQGEGLVIINNKGTVSIFLCFDTSATVAPALTINNGIEIGANASAGFDDIGGLAIWAIAASLQVANAGTRVTGAKPSVI